MTVAPERPASVSPPPVVPAVDQARFRHVERLIERHLPPSAGRPVHDSVVIAGGKGITAWTLAARLARSEQFAGKVVITGPPVEETRQIVNGVSLRGAAADFLCYALGCSQADLVRQFTGTHFAGQPVATRQLTAMAKPGAGGYRIGPATAFQGGSRGMGRPLLFGTRNSRLANAIRELLDERGIVDLDEPIASLDDARALAPGRNPLLINLTRNPRLFGATPVQSSRVTLAWQVPLAVGPSGLRRPLTGSTAFAPLVHRDGIIDVGYFTPFADPLSPTANWYGLMVRPQRDASFDKDRELRVLREQVLGVAEAVGLEPVDEEQTAFGGKAPAPPIGRPPRSAPGTLELRGLCTPGAVAYYADGMVGGAIGAVMTAEALIRGADPYGAVVDALARLRRWNDIWWFETTRMAPIVDAFLGASRLTGRLAMSFPHTCSVNDWASHA